MKKILLAVLIILLFVLAFIGFKAVKADDPVCETAEQKAKGFGVAGQYSPEWGESDQTGLNVCWWYDWGSTRVPNAKYVPMSWCGEIPAYIDASYTGYLMVFNEPDHPKQCNITPEVGITRYNNLTTLFPLAQMVVGNTFYPSYDDEHPGWNVLFKQLCEADPTCSDHVPTIWGQHFFYSDGGFASSFEDFVFDFFGPKVDADHIRLGGTMWITEFTDTHGNFYHDKIFIKEWLEPRVSYIPRYALIISRATRDEDWYPEEWDDVRMYYWDTDTLTPKGWWYAGYGWRQWLPILISGEDFVRPTPIPYP